MVPNYVEGIFGAYPTANDGNRVEVFLHASARVNLSASSLCPSVPLAPARWPEQHPHWLGRRWSRPPQRTASSSE